MTGPRTGEHTVDIISSGLTHISRSTNVGWPDKTEFPDLQADYETLSHHFPSSRAWSCSSTDGWWESDKRYLYKIQEVPQTYCHDAPGGLAEFDVHAVMSKYQNMTNEYMRTNVIVGRDTLCRILR